METDIVADHIGSLSSDRVPKRQLDIAVTVLLLRESGPNWRVLYDGLRQGRYKLDHELVVKLLETANKKVQWHIVRSPAFWHLPKQLFRQHFFHFWHLRRRYSYWRWLLGGALHSFLLNNSPQEGPVYAKIIWTLAGDPDEGIALTGLNCTGYLGSILTLEQARTLISLTRHKSMKGFAAKSQLGTLYKNFDNLRPEVKALFRDPWTVATLRINRDPTDTDKWGAHNWCLMNMRRVLPRSQARTLKLVK